MTEAPSSRLREATLWVGAGLGLLSLVAGVAVMFFGFTFLIFRSGSMGPDIPTGSLALARTTPAAELESGDVVSVLASNGARITHRLVSATVRGDEASLILEGDANGTPDAEIYQVTEAERSIVSVPYAGYVVTVLLSPAGLVAAGCLSGMVFLLGFGSTSGESGTRSRPGSDSGAGRHRGERESRRRLASAGIAAMVASAAVVAWTGVSGTSAYFTDPATAGTGTFSSGSVAVP
ncbi:MAG: signal peptidase I, partial [Nocardioides sp.]|uniref:signal peptidase I n=1 Tax=Nocardioides sp. TaxID=35761 RepID=UPI00238D0759